jgi:phosphoglycerate dehydrogenase-like enzyme
MAWGLLERLATQLENAGHEALRVKAADGLLREARWKQVDLLVAALASCGRAEMEACPNLRGIVSPLAGYDHIDLVAAIERGVPVVNGAMVENQVSMAEATFMLILVALYDLHATENMLWPASNASLPVRRMLQGKTIGIIGFGNIAKSLVARLKGWNTRIQVFSHSANSHENVEFVELDTLLETSDIVAVLTNLNARTRHLLDSTRLSHIKQGAIIVNTARGGIIDEAALAHALRSGRVAKAMLDVFEIEPLPDDSPLRQLPNVVLTPHSVGHTKEVRDKMVPLAVENVLTLLDGKLPTSCLNPQIADRWFGSQQQRGMDGSCA